MKLRTGVLGALLAALALALGGCFVLFERVEEERETGLSARALANPFLAAERLAGRMGLEAASVRGPASLPPTEFALVLVTPRRTLGEDRARWLLDWVAAGGHLIVTPRVAEDEEDPLLAGLGITLEALADDAASGEEADAEPDGAEDGEVYREPVHLRPFAGARSYAVAFGAAPRLALGDAAPAFADEAGRLARFSHGGGWITVLADASFLSNGRIGEHEHAAFFWSLLQVPAAPAGVWLVYRDRMPPLLRLIVQRGWTVLAAASCFLAAWLWLRGPRFGPLAETASPERRSLAEHLEATAEFLWREGQAAGLLDAERQALLRAAERAHPGWAALPERERLRQLASLAGLSGGQLRRALEEPVANDPTEFTRMITLLENVRRSL